jgi:hypothetical protein
MWKPTASERGTLSDAALERDRQNVSDGLDLRRTKSGLAQASPTRQCNRDT